MELRWMAKLVAVILAGTSWVACQHANPPPAAPTIATDSTEATAAAGPQDAATYGGSDASATDAVLYVEPAVGNGPDAADARTSPASTAASPATSPETPSAPCPDDSTLRQVAEELLGRPATHAAMETDVQGCEAAHLPEPGWLVHVMRSPVNETDDGPVDDVIFAVSADAVAQTTGGSVHVEVVLKRRYPSWAAVAVHGYSTDVFAVADLDGDGTDEALIDESSSNFGESETDLRVFRRAGAAYREVATLTTSFDDTPAQVDEGTASECEATVKLGDPLPDGSRRLLVTGTIRRGEAADPERIRNCVDGSVILRLVGDGLEPDQGR